jgi:SAM-dependent methyltransferase
MPSIPSLSVLWTVTRELLTTERAPRVPEPDLVMNDPEKVAAFNRAGREDGVMAPVYLLHAAHVSEVIKPGDVVVDLGCGPGNQLGLVARLNPETRFIGVDLSDDMIARARTNLYGAGIHNVELRKGDITDLAFLEDESVDAVFSTVVLHHLPDKEHLERTFREIRRVLKKGGGVFLSDFGHLRSEESIRIFAHQYADRQPELFTLDYHHSLRAAFHLADFKQLTRLHLTGIARVRATTPIPFLVTVKSEPQRRLPARTIHALRALHDDLPQHHKADIRDLTLFLRLGGLRTPVLDSPGRPRRASRPLPRPTGAQGSPP